MYTNRDLWIVVAVVSGLALAATVVFGLLTGMWFAVLCVTVPAWLGLIPFWLYTKPRMPVLDPDDVEDHDTRPSSRQ